VIRCRRVLEVGAEDYVTKPFSAAELGARIKAVMRRFEDDDGGGSYRFGDCEIDFDRAEIRRSGQPIQATALECDRRLSAAILKSAGPGRPRLRRTDFA